MSLIKRIFCSPAPMWMVVCFFVLSLVAATEAAIVTYTGSFNVATSGTLTDSNQSASSASCYNASHQLTSSCAAVSPTYNVITAGSVSATTLAGTNVTSKAGGSTAAPVGPCYASGGTACGSTFHIDVISCVGSSSGPCTVTLSGAAAFTSSSSFACGASPVIASGGDSNAYIISSTSVALQTDIGTSTTLTAVCAGT